LPSEHGFPDTLTYVVWALTMILPALWAYRKIGGVVRHDPRSIALGAAIGLLGAGGQILLFHAVTIGPTYLIFPIVSLSPAVTILLSLAFLGERTGKLGVAGIALALASLPLFDYAPESGVHFGLWFVLSLLIMAAWGLQAYYIMDAESIFVYMTLSGIVLIPGALLLTDFSKPIYMGFSGPYLAAGIQILNAVGALLLVYAFRYGKAIVVSPLVNAGAPLLTTVIALGMVGTLPSGLKLLAVILALAGAVLLSTQP
jgi:drug/metabolite transporter (DMT)-like permease